MTLRRVLVSTAVAFAVMAGFAGSARGQSCPFSDGEACDLHDAVLRARALETRLAQSRAPAGPKGLRGDPGPPGPAGARGQRGLRLSRAELLEGLRVIARTKREASEARDLAVRTANRLRAVGELMTLMFGEVEHLEALSACVVEAEGNGQSPKEECPL